MSDSDIKQEVLIEDQPSPVSLKGTKKILSQLENCICQLCLKNGGKGTGFFTKIKFKNKLLPVLITNNHVLKEEDIKNNEIIKLTRYNNIENKDEDISITIDDSRIRYTNSEKDIDITIIEIKPVKDKINNYLEIDEEELTENQYIKSSIYLLHYPNEKYVSYGLINELREYKTIIHYCNTEDGASGSPILSLKTNKVIGVHYGGIKKYNCGTYIKYAIDEINNKYKNEINLKYITEEEKEENIFGEKFVKNNKNNIELEINGEKSKLVKRYKLIKGINNIKMLIKNKLTNLEYMFYKCKSLKDINELKYLDIKDINNFEYMFCGCSSLSDIKSLQNWNVSNGNNFKGMFGECSSLLDIKPLKNWNVSNGNNFSGMFYKSSSLSDIEPLQNWDVSNGKNFELMFNGCPLLSDIKPLQNWNVSNGNNFGSMFYGCSSLSDIKSLQNWNVSKGNNFEYMLCGCSSLSDIKPLQNWNVSNGKNFESMFYGCSSSLDIKPLQNWKFSKNNYNFLK